MKLGVLIAFIVVLAGASFGQSPSTKWEIFAEGGGSIWNNRYLDSNVEFGSPPMNQTLLLTTRIGSSGRFFVGFRFWMNAHEAIESSYSYTPSDITTSQHCEDVNCGTSSSTSIARSHFFAVNYVHAFRVRSRVQPFLTAGLGLVHFQMVLGTDRNGVYEGDPFTVNIGGGVDIRISPHWLLRIEDRDWLLETPRQSDFYQYGATGLAHNQVPSIGVVYRF